MSSSRSRVAVERESLFEKKKGNSFFLNGDYDWKKEAAVFSTLAFGGILLQQGLTVVPAGHVGVLVPVPSASSNDNQITSTILPPGWHFHLPFRRPTRCVKLSTQIQHVSFRSRVLDTQGKKVFVSILIQYHLVDPQLYVQQQQQQSRLVNDKKENPKRGSNHLRISMGDIQSQILEHAKPVLASVVAQHNLSDRWWDRNRQYSSQTINNSNANDDSNSNNQITSNNSNYHLHHHSPPVEEVITSTMSKRLMQEGVLKGLDITKIWITGVEMAHWWDKLVDESQTKAYQTAVEKRKEQLAEIKASGQHENIQQRIALIQQQLEEEQGRRNSGGK